MKYGLLYGILMVILTFRSLAQDYGAIAIPAGMIREDRSSVDKDSVTSKRSNIEQGISIYPNPATDHIWVVISSDYPVYYSALIYDINGMQLLKKYWLTQPGTNKYYLPLPPGAEPLPLYIKIYGPWPGGARIFRIVKQI